MRRVLILLVIISAAVPLSGCYLDDLFSKKGDVKVSLTDAPVDDLDQVHLTISSVELKPSSRSTESFNFDPPVVINNLLDLSGGLLSTLLTSEQVPAGDYDWVRFHITAAGADSFVVDTGGNDYDLYTSGQLPGASSAFDYIQLDQPFAVDKGDTLWLVLDIDLRRALYRPAGQNYYVLMPALRLINYDDSASVKGTVSAALVEDSSCTSDTTTGKGNAVYIYSGTSVSPGNVYLDSAGAALGVGNPVTVAPVVDNNGSYSYTASWLPSGSYTLALTCQSLGDDPLQDDAIVFPQSATVSLNAGDEQTLDF